MNLHLPVRPRIHGSALNEAQAWKDRALAAEEELAHVRLLNANQATTIALLNEDKTVLLGVLDEAREVLRDLNAKFDGQAVTP